MTTYEILEAFGKYADYDPNRRSFNLLSAEYVFHEACKKITEIVDKYDPSGRLGVLFAKRTYMQVISESKVKLLDILKDENALNEEKAMYGIFTSEDVRKIEEEYVESLNSVLQVVVGRSMLGERNKDEELAVVYNAVESVVRQLGRCHEDVYVNSGLPVDKVSNISTMIHPFNYMAECVLSIQNEAPDGAYLCYIQNNGTADGYFAIVIKSNGNIFSLNDNVPESYIGQHNHSRNGRWADGHQDELFPYEHILSFGNYDYKGYAHSYTVQDEKLSFTALEPKAYIPVILAILFVINAHAGRPLDETHQVYLNTLIQANLPSYTDANALAVIDKTGLIKSTTQQLDIHFDDDKLLSGEYDKEFNDRYHYLGKRQMWVDMYGQGFVPSKRTLSMTASTVLLPDTKPSSIHPEFVGTLSAMRRQAYYETRIELAEYIKQNMKKELDAFGGVEAITQWWKSALDVRKDTILKQLIDFASKAAIDAKGAHYIKHEGDPTWYEHVSVKTANLGHKDIRGVCMNELGSQNVGSDWRSNKACICPINGERATVWFCIYPRDWHEIEELLGCEVPKIVKGWQYNDVYYGNSILDSVDAVEALRLPFVKQGRLDITYEFLATVGFSKRGLKKVLKEASSK